MGIVLVAAAALRLWNLGAAPFWYDEAMYAILARQFSPKLLDGSVLLVEPLFVGFLSFWIKLGTGEFWFRLPAAMAGIATVATAIAYGHYTGGRRAASYAAALTAAAPALVYYSRDGKMYGQVIFFVLIAGYAALRFAEGSRPWPMLALYALAAAAVANTYFAAPLFLAAISLACCLFYFRRVSQFVLWTLANLVVLAVTLPFLRAELTHSVTMRDKVFHAQQADLPALAITWSNLFTAYTPNDYLRMAAAILFALLVAAALVPVPTRRRAAYLVVTGCVPILGLWTASNVLTWSIYIDRYVIAAAGPLLIACALGIASLPGRVLAPRALILCLLVSAGGLVAVYTRQLPADETKHRGIMPAIEAPAMAATIRSLGQPGDLVCHAFLETEPVLRWYAPEFEHVLVDDQGGTQAMLDALCSKKYQDFYGWHPQDIRAVLSRASRIWLVQPEGTLALRATASGARNTLGEFADVLHTQTYGKGEAATSLTLFALRRGEAPSDGGPSGAVYESRAPLAGDCVVTLRGDNASGFQLVAQNTAARPLAIPIEWVSCERHVAASTLSAKAPADCGWYAQDYLAADATRPAIFGRTHPNETPPAPLSWNTELGPGRYALFIERTLQGTAYTIPTATLAFDIDGQRSISPGAPLAADDTGGWRWMKAARITLDAARTVTIGLSVIAPEARPEEYAVFSRLVICRDDQGELNAPPVQTSVLQVPPGQTLDTTLHAPESATHIMVLATHNRSACFLSR